MGDKYTLISNEIKGGHTLTHSDTHRHTWRWGTIV